MVKPKRKRRTKAQMEAARAAEAAASTPKPKRKRRTKKEMEAARAGRHYEPTSAVRAVEAEIKIDADKRGHRPGSDAFKSYRRGWLAVAFPK